VVTPVSGSYVTVVNANSNRRGLLIYSEVSSPTYVKIASPGGFIVDMYYADYWEMPAPIYQGSLTVYCSGTVSGSLEVTEIT
jgi:hypothetical protein